MFGFIKRHAGIILGVASAIGTVASVVATAKAAPKAEQDIHESENTKGEELTFVEKVKACWKRYILAFVLTTATVATILGSTVLSYKQQVALIGLYSAAQLKLKDAAIFEKSYREEVIKRHGEEEDMIIVGNIAQQCSEYHWVGNPTPDKKAIWIDHITGVEHEAYEREIIDAKFHWNRNYVMGGGNTYYDWIAMFAGVDAAEEAMKKHPNLQKIGYIPAAYDAYTIDWTADLKGRRDGKYVYELYPEFDPDDIEEQERACGYI